MNLLKRLEIGLIAVGTHAEVIIETFGFDLKKSINSSKKQKEKINQRIFTKKKSF